MNRPKLKQYWCEALCNHEADYKDYLEDLEKYCDELEHELEVLKEEYNADQKYIEDFDTTKDWYWKKIKQLEKALGKACKFISGIFNDHEDERIYWEKEDWKKYLLEDQIKLSMKNEINRLFI